MYMHTSSGKVSSKYSTAIAFQKMSNTNCILHEVIIFEGMEGVGEIYKISIVQKRKALLSYISVV
jgi:hypothetical protein